MFESTRVATARAYAPREYPDTVASELALS